MIGGGENRPWAPDIQNSRDTFKRDQEAYEKVYEPQYAAAVQALKKSEAERGVTAMYKLPKKLPGDHDRNGSDLYDPASHARLYGIAQKTEEAAYR
jgi:hypothetical protein